MPVELDTPAKKKRVAAARRKARKKRAKEGKCIGCPGKRDRKSMRCSACSKKAADKQRENGPKSRNPRRDLKPLTAAERADSIVLPPVQEHRRIRVPTFDDFESGTRREPRVDYA